MSVAPPLIYVMGTARSGSTILGMLLGAAPGAAMVGELSWAIRDGMQGNVTCSCGVAARACPVWGPALAAVESAGIDAAAAAAARDATDGHRAFPRAWFGRVDRPAAPLWERTHDVLLEALSRGTGSTTLIDTSKYAARALALSRRDPGVRVICLTRSPAGLLRAFAKPNPTEQRPKGLVSAAAYYTAVLGCLRLARGRLGARVLDLTFEALLSDPLGALRRIEAWSGLPLDAARRIVEAGSPLPPGHVLTGNRLRREAAVRFRGDRDHDVTSARPGLARRATAFALDVWRRGLGMA